MADAVWKSFERTVARYFKCERNPLSSRWSKHDTESDTLHPRLYIEAKRDKKYLGVTFLRLLKETAAKAKKEKKSPVVCLKEHNKEGFWIVVHSKYLRDVAKEQV